VLVYHCASSDACVLDRNQTPGSRDQRLTATSTCHSRCPVHEVPPRRREEIPVTPDVPGDVDVDDAGRAACDASGYSAAMAAAPMVFYGVTTGKDKGTFDSFVAA
jgi:hypothetical protein